MYLQAYGRPQPAETTSSSDSGRSKAESSESDQLPSVPPPPLGQVDHPALARGTRNGLQPEPETRASDKIFDQILYEACADSSTNDMAHCLRLQKNEPPCIQYRSSAWAYYHMAMIPAGEIGHLTREQAQRVRINIREYTEEYIIALEPLIDVATLFGREWSNDKLFAENAYNICMSGRLIKGFVEKKEDGRIIISTAKLTSNGTRQPYMEVPKLPDDLEWCRDFFDTRVPRSVCDEAISRHQPTEEDARRLQKAKERMENSPEFRQCLGRVGLMIPIQAYSGQYYEICLRAYGSLH